MYVLEAMRKCPAHFGTNSLFVNNCCVFFSFWVKIKIQALSAEGLDGEQERIVWLPNMFMFF